MIERPVGFADVAPGEYGGDRTRRWVPGSGARQTRRAVGLPSEGRGGMLPPSNGKVPGYPGRLRRGSLPVHLPSFIASCVRWPRPGRQAWRAGGVPLKPWGKVSQTCGYNVMTWANVATAANMRTYLA